MLNLETFKEKLNEEELGAVMLLLQNFSRAKPLPVGLEKELDEWMDKIRPEQGDVLEPAKAIPEYAYYVIAGYVYVIYEDENAELQVYCFYRNNRIVALRDFVDQEKSDYVIIAGRDTVLGRISIDGMRAIYRKWPDMEGFAKSIVMKYADLQIHLRNHLLRYKPEERARVFFGLYKCLKPARLIKLTKEIGLYLGISESSVLRGSDDEDEE